MSVLRRFRPFLPAAVLLAISSPAAASAEEHRLSLTPAAGTLSVEVGGASEANLALGGQVRYGFGWTNAIEIGGSVRLGWAPAVSVAGATLEEGGQAYTGTLLGSANALQVGADVRWYGTGKVSEWFRRTQPFAGVGGGVVGLIVYNQDLVEDDGMNAGIGLIEPPPADLVLRPFVAAELGVEHRVSRAFKIGVAFSTTYGGAALVAANASLELSFLWY